MRDCTGEAHRVWKRQRVVAAHLAVVQHTTLSRSLRPYTTPRPCCAPTASPCATTAVTKTRPPPPPPVLATLQGT